MTVYPHQFPRFYYRGEQRPHVVYELWLEGQCVYVGVTADLTRRLSEHRKFLRSPWDEVRTTAASNREVAEGLEKALIFTLRPTRNLRWNPNHDRTLLSRGGFSTLLAAAAP